MRSRHHWWLGLLLGVVIALSSQLPLAVGWQPTRAAAEVRGIWLTNIDSDVLFSRQRLSGALERLARLHFNAVYPTVWNGGYTLYPSTVARKVVGRSLPLEPGLQQRDLLAEVVTQGHQRGLQVIPWFEFGLMAPANSELARRHPDWITRRRDGTEIVKEGQDNRVWLNPFHPQVQQFIVDLVAEIVSIYQVDGIQLDDHFGLPTELGYDPYTVQLYQHEHRGKRPPNNPRDSEWMRWRADKITELMARMFRTVKVLNPDCLVVLAPNPLSFSYQHYLQDWQSWERYGLIEDLILQVYRDNFKSFITELERPEVQAARRHIPVSVGILIGLKNYSVSIRQVQQQVQAVRQRGFTGVSFFYYETLGNRDRAFQELLTPVEQPTKVLQS